jgi:fructokinase
MINNARPTDMPPAVVGMGLIALDVVSKRESASAARFFAGGTCGNVLAILAYLGWKAMAVARFGNDANARRVLKDLRRWGVQTNFACLRPTAKAPVIVEWISTDRDGQGSHRFSFTCPECGSWFPGFRPVPVAAVEPVLDALAPAQVFFFDRPSRSSLTVAKGCREKGACVYFEPSTVGDPKLFREALEVSHVVKYASERMNDLGEMKRLPEPLIEIGTLGSAGLRFRSRCTRSRTSGWRRLHGFPVKSVRDTAGCGDWLTAVLLNRIARRGLASVKRVDLEQLTSVLSESQAAAAWNCSFEAARGGMMTTSPQELDVALRAIQDGSAARDDSHDQKRRLARTAASIACLSCREPSRTSINRRSNAVTAR